MTRLILISLFCFSCVTDKQKVTSNKDEKILPQRYIVYNNFPSKYVIPRNVEVWLPTEYDNLQSLPVLYMFDGQNIFHGNKSWMGGGYDHGWQVDGTLDSLYTLGKIPRMIVVGIFNTGVRRFSEYMPSKPKEKIEERMKYANEWAKKSLDENKGIKSDSLLKFIVEELKPYIDMNYKTKKERENTYIAGSSMGGLISAYAICEYPEIFGYAACISTHWPALDGVFIEYLKNNIPNPKSHMIYFDYGTEGVDQKYEPYQKKVDSIMISKGYKEYSNWITKKFDGEDHNADYWRERFHYPIEFFFTKK